MFLRCVLARASATQYAGVRPIRKCTDCTHSCTVVQVLGPHLAGLENISRRFINNLVWDLIVVSTRLATGYNLHSKLGPKLHF